jgi:hypothetical protein
MLARVPLYILNSEMFNPPKNEAELLQQTRWLLDLLEKYGYLAYTRIHVMPIIRGWARGKPILSPNNDMRGFPDIEIVARGKVAYLELKSVRGSLSKEQIEFSISRTKHGAIVKRCMSLEDVIDAVELLGIDVRRFIKFGGMD